MITDFDFVGFEDEMQKIRMSLVDGPKELDVVSLVGMPGNGKTTLAQKLYQDPSVRLHFDIRAWCTVSQLYRKINVWKTLLCQVSGRDSEIVDDDEDGIAERIAQSLKRRRYLIIIDDIWEIKAWTDLRRYLPNDNNGSRILITTRHQDVAKQTSSVPSNVHSLRVFTECESYELFERKSGLKNNYQTDELKQVGHQIALSCKGLPLAIAIAGGHLAKAEQNVVEWRKVLAGLSSRILNDKDRPYSVMLEWSYNCLPNHLKPCFLYAGVLAAYQPVRVWKLTWLWIAEGLVYDDNFECVEKLTQEYLRDLINRSLLIPTRERAIGGVKEFRMHDLLIDFCLELSEEQNFMHKIKHHSRSEPYDSTELVHVDETDGSRGLSIGSRGYAIQISKHSGSAFASEHCVRSLITFPFGSIGSDDFYSAINSMDFEHLQVLDINEELQIDDILEVDDILGRIKLRTHLKYLAVSSSFFSLDPFALYLIPSSIVSFRSLQTLILHYPKSSSGRYVPDSLWDMENLRNVRVVGGGLVRFEVESGRLEKSSFPENMETLSTPFFSSALDAEMLRRMPMLQKLSFKCSNCQIIDLDFLTRLMSLKISGNYPFGPTVGLYNLTFPSNLKKLTLRYCMISWDEISSLGRKLPNLEVLKMFSTGKGGTWTVMAGDFPNLRYLKITMNSSFTEWLASEESFPKLEQLHLGYLADLEEIPCCFDDAVCLRVITVEYCQRNSLYDSATRIGKVQKEELLNEEFVADVSERDSPLGEVLLQTFQELASRIY